MRTSIRLPILNITYAMTPTSRHLFTVSAECDPQLPGRILDLFAQRNLLPQWFSVRRIGAAELRVTVETDEIDASICNLMAQKMLNIPTVLAVSLSPLRQSAEISPCGCYEAA